jgi:hypothetical protein
MSSHRRGREAAAEPVLRWGGRLAPELPAFFGPQAPPIPAGAVRREDPGRTGTGVGIGVRKRIGIHLSVDIHPGTGTGAAARGANRSRGVRAA